MLGGRRGLLGGLALLVLFALLGGSAHADRLADRRAEATRVQAPARADGRRPREGHRGVRPRAGAGSTTTEAAIRDNPQQLAVTTPQPPVAQADSPPARRRLPHGRSRRHRRAPRRGLDVRHARPHRHRQALVRPYCAARRQGAVVQAAVRAAHRHAREAAQAARARARRSRRPQGGDPRRHRARKTGSRRSSATSARSSRARGRRARRRRGPRRRRARRVAGRGSACRRRSRHRRLLERLRRR